MERETVEYQYSHAVRCHATIKNRILGTEDTHSQRGVNWLLAGGVEKP